MLELNPLPVSIRGDRIQMQQVLLNLIINGLEAIKQAASGDATLVVRTMQPDEQWDDRRRVGQSEKPLFAHADAHRGWVSMSQDVQPDVIHHLSRN